MEQLVQLLKSVNQEQFNEVFDQISEVLDLNTEDIGSSKESKIEALRQSILEYDDTDEQQAIINEISLFFEEDGNQRYQHVDTVEKGNKTASIKWDLENENYMVQMYDGEEYVGEETFEDEEEAREAAMNFTLTEGYDKSTTQDGFRDAKKKNKKGKGGKEKKIEDGEDEMPPESKPAGDDSVAGGGTYNKKHSKASVESYQISSSDIDLSEDINTIFKGEKLNEELQERAKTVFESAVVRKVNEKINSIIEEYNDMLEEKVQDVEEDLTEKVDEYLNYVVNEWVEENQLAIENGIMNEMSESFIAKLKDILDEHYVEVPEDKRDVVAEQQEKINKLEVGLNEAHEKNSKLYKQLTESRKDDVIEQESEGLSQMQKDKLEELVEGIDFDPENIDSFRKKVNIIKENYFPVGKSNDSKDFRQLDEESNLDNQEIEDDDDTPSEIQTYAKYLERLNDN